MILGIGTDLVDARRIEKVLTRYPQTFPRKILSAIEQTHWTHNPTPLSMAKRFALKEAAAKACGVGIGKDLSFQDMHIQHARQAPPRITFSSRTLAKLWPNKDTKKIKVDASLSDEYPYVQAFVIISEVAGENA